MTDARKPGEDDGAPTSDFVTKSHYAKIYASILDSSVWSESVATRVVWVAMLAMCNREGFVEASFSGLCRRANVSASEGREAIKALEAPDMDSKSPEWGGRRIEKVEGGWQILNYAKYRDAQTPKQIQTAERQRRFRERRQAEAEWSKLNPGQTLPADFHENLERYVPLHNGDKRLTRTVAVTGTVSASSSPSSEPGTVENPVEAVGKPEQVGTEQEPFSPESSIEGRIAGSLESNLDRKALAEILEAAPSRGMWSAEIAASLEGMHGPQLTGKQLGECLRDYVGNGHTASPNFKHFRAYLRRPDRAPETRQGSASAAPASSSSSGNGQAADDAGILVAKILEAKETNTPPGQAPKSFIRRSLVEAMGSAVLTAYDAVGGADRFLAVTGATYSYLVRDFGVSLRAARNGSH